MRGEEFNSALSKAYCASIKQGCEERDVKANLVEAATDYYKRVQRNKVKGKMQQKQIS